MPLNLKQNFSTQAGNLKQLLHTTAMEVVLGAVAMCGILTMASYHVQQGNEGKIQVAFSEVGKTMRNAEYEGKTVPPLTQFYAKNNDFLMQFFEASDIAMERSRDNLTFAQELEFKNDPSYRVHRQIPAYAAELPGIAQQALGSVHKLTEAQQELPGIIAEFDAAWSEHHHDVTHTVHHHSCDSDGKNCTDSDEEVYDYTIHTYDYHAAQGEQASRDLDAFLQRHPDLNIDEKLIPATSTEAENEYAIEKSFKEALGGKIPTPEQALYIANTWARGSNLSTYEPVVMGNEGALHGDAPAWDASKGTAHYERYTTYSHSDSGPAEYQVTKRAAAHAQAICDAANKVTAGMEFAAQQTPKLHALATEYIGVMLDYKPGNANKIRSEMMSLARQEYQMNYEKGLDVQPFKWAIVLLFAGIGLLTGGLLGKGVAMTLDNFREKGMTFGDFIKHPAWKSLSLPFGASARREKLAQALADADTPFPTRHGPRNLNL